ncbi:MAG: response regulator [Pseudonocardia sp.]
MITSESVLIVEDEDDWSAIYQRAAHREGVQTVRIAKNLAQAEDLLSKMSFAVAFVDIGLDVDDDRNVDGLRAMERVRAIGDETSLIVITGRSGRDVLPITRDAIKKYRAFDAISKVPVEPNDLRRLLTEGLLEYRRVAALSRPRVADVLRGGTQSGIWDDRMLRALPIKGGVRAFYELLERLFAEFLPVVSRESDSVVNLQAGRALALGEFWSRARGVAVLVCFGDGGEVDALTDEVEAGRMALDRYHSAELLNESSLGSLRGVVLALPEEPREGFM